MKLPYINNTLNLKNKKGQSAITLAMLTITFLILIGFAVDTANLLLKKSHLQRALDAGAIAGITRYAKGDAQGTIATTAQQMALYNLQQMGFSPAQITSVTANLTVDPNTGTATLSANGTLTTNTLFMRLIPGAGLATVTTAGTSTAQRNPAIISLVLDVSGSMGPFLNDLRDAANDFVDFFEDGIDKMAIVKFDRTATVIAAMAPVNKSDLHAAINDPINGLVIGSGTGISRAVVVGRTQLESVAASSNAVRAMVFFTDGAPNVIRGTFTNGNVANLPHNPPASPNYDYAVYFYTARVEMHNPTTLTEVCTRATPLRLISQCLNSYAYLDSKGNPGHYAHIPNLSATSEMRKENYDLAVIESDYVKSAGTTVYSIGLGTEAAVTSDPYQNVAEDFRLKSVLLRRMANDPVSASDPQFPGLPSNNTHPKGTYLQTPNASELKSLFQTIAQKIKLRLI